MKAALLQALQSWMEILPVVDRYDQDPGGYTLERSLELQNSLEEPLGLALQSAQTIRRTESSRTPEEHAELQRFADALVVSLLALRRLPGQTPPPCPEAGDMLRLLTPSLQSWLQDK